MTARPMTLGAVAVALGMFAGQAAAQDAAPCSDVLGQPVPWILDTAEASDLSNLQDAVDLNLTIPPNGAQVVAFRVSAPVVARIEAATIGDGDPVLDLVTSEGALVASDDDGGGGRDARIETSLPEGTYCASARGYNAEFFTITLRVGREDHTALTTGPVDAGVCTAQTDTIPLSDAPLNAILGEGPASATAAAAAAPFYHFTLTEPTAISITAENLEADPTLSLYDADGVLIAENDDFDGVNARIDQIEALQPGRYCIGVGALSDTNLPIVVTASAFSEDAYLATLYDAGSAAPPLGSGYPVEHLGTLTAPMQSTVRSGRSVSWISFDLPGESLVVIEGIALGGSDPLIALFDSFGREIGRDDDSGRDLDAMLARKLGRGTYLAAIGRGGTGSQVTRVVIERYVPAE